MEFRQAPSGNPPNLKVKINQSGTDVTTGIFDLDISITHPYPGTNLREFDVRGIVMGNGKQVSKFDKGVKYSGQNDLRLLNADGYTRWWNPVEFLTPGLFGYTPGAMAVGTANATVNGYKYFANGLSSGGSMPPDLSNRGTFSSQSHFGGENTLTRRCDQVSDCFCGKPQARFEYAICASWVDPIPGAKKPAPIDSFPLTANCSEALDHFRFDRSVEYCMVYSFSIGRRSCVEYSSFRLAGENESARSSGRNLEYANRIAALERCDRPDCVGKNDSVGGRAYLDLAGGNRESDSHIDRSGYFRHSAIVEPRFLRSADCGGGSISGRGKTRGISTIYVSYSIQHASGGRDNFRTGCVFVGGQVSIQVELMSDLRMGGRI